MSLDEALTRASPDPRVDVVAGGLRALGVAPNDCVAWQSPNRDEVRVIYRACWRLGATAVPMHHQVGSADVERLLSATTPKVVVDLDALPEGSPVADVWTDASARAAILFTAGTTGAPKGVIHSQATLAYKALQMAQVHELGPDDCALMPAPCAHISGLLNGITLPGVVPFRVVFMSKWDPAIALDLIEREHVTFMIGPPTFFVSMMQAPSFSTERVHSMRLISSGGAGVSNQFVAEATERFGCKVKRTYGSTEAPSVITDGVPNGDVELRVDDNGELLVRGREVALGYLDREQTAAAFTPDGWYRTGDLATITNCIVDVTGRLRDIIIRGGENISIAEVEAVLEAHPSIRQAVVVGIPDELMGERVVAFVIADAALSVDHIRAWFTEQHIARYKTPEKLVLVDEIPMLATGKPDRLSLRTQHF